MSEVGTKKREDLTNRIEKELKELYDKNLVILRHFHRSLFEEKMKERFGKDQVWCKQFSNETNLILDSLINQFVSAADESKLQSTNWSSDHEVEVLRKDVLPLIAVERSRQILLLAADIKDQLKKKFLSPLSSLLEDSPVDMWVQIRTLFTKTTSQTQEYLTQSLSAFDLTEEEINEKIVEIDHVILTMLREKVKEKAGYLQTKIERRFDDLFRHDERGFLRRWTNEDIDALYNSAKLKAIELINVFAVIRLDSKYDSVIVLPTSTKKVAGKGEVLDTDGVGGPGCLEDLPQDIVVLSYDECCQLRDRFYKSSETAYEKARHDQDAHHVNSAGNVVKLLIGLVVILGFNELQEVLRFFGLPILELFKFLLFMSLLFFGGIGYLYYTGRLDTIPFLKPTVELVISMAQKKISEIMNPKKK